MGMVRFGGVIEEAELYPGLMIKNIFQEICLYVGKTFS
jgi:hypothetical protein